MLKESPLLSKVRKDIEYGIGDWVVCTKVSKKPYAWEAYFYCIGIYGGTVWAEQRGNKIYWKLNDWEKMYREQKYFEEREQKRRFLTEKTKLICK